MTTEKRKRSNYTEDFKRDAVALVTEQGYKISEMYDPLGHFVYFESHGDKYVSITR